MAHRLNWSLGQQGKGLVLRNGDVHTWRPGLTGGPHHDEYWHEQGLTSQPVEYLMIAPDGELITNDRSTHGLQKAVQADPHLYIGDPYEDDANWDLDPNWESPDPKPGTDYNFVLRSNTEDEAEYVTMLKDWLDNLPGAQQPQPLTVHHDSPQDMALTPPESPGETTALYPPGHEPDYMKQGSEAIKHKTNPEEFARRQAELADPETARPGEWAHDDEPEDQEEEKPEPVKARWYSRIWRRF